MVKLLLVGGTLLVLTWSGLRVLSARSWAETNGNLANRAQQALGAMQPALEKMPAYKLTSLGVRMLKAGDYGLAQAALKTATEKDHFYRDAFRYYALALQATGDSSNAELALRRAKTLDPRETP